MDEYDIADVAKGMRVVIKTDATGDEELEGEITFVSPTPSDNSAAMGSSSGESGYPVEIRLNTENERLRIGMTAKASIVLEESRDVFAVPYDAIHTNEAGESVIYIKEQGNSPVNGNKENGTKEIPVTKGLESDYYTEITGDELEEGMEVVLDGQNALQVSDEKVKETDEGGMFDKIGGAPDGGGKSGGGGFGGAPGGVPGGF